MQGVDPQLQAYYGLRAGYYDAVYERPERAADIALLRQLWMGRLTGRRVLEVACGTGYWTQHVAPVSAALVATDATPEPLDLARQRPHAERARFAIADAYQLDAGLGRFDAAFAGLWLSHVPIGRRAQFLRSLHRLLEPGARVLLFDNSQVQLRDFPIVERDAEGNTFQQRVLRDGSVHRVLKNFPGQDELVALVAGIGTEPRYRMLENFWWFEYVLV